nr:hypothetical protein GTC16762_08420 [Pigmentibacter ruber]
MITNFLSVFLMLNAFSYFTAFYMKSIFEYYCPIIFVLNIIISFYISFFKLKYSDKIYLPSMLNFIFLFLVILFYSRVTYFQYNSLGIDEYYRLGMARYLDNHGFPVTNQLFVASDNTQKNAYYFLYFLAISIRKCLFNMISIEVIYNYVFLYIRYILTIFLYLEIFNSVLYFLNISKKIYQEKKIYLEIFFSLGVLSLIIPPIPYALGVISLFEQQSSFVLIIILLIASLMISLLKELYESKRSSKIFLLFVLLCMMPVVIFITKFPYLPVILCGIFCYVFLVFVLFKEYIKYLSPILIFSLIILAIIYKFNPILPLTNVIRGEHETFIYFSKFELIKGVGIRGYFPWIKSIYLSAFISFGLLWLWLLILAKKILSKYKIIHLNIFYFTLLVMSISGYIATCIVRLKAYTGGAESYWSYAGWYSMTILISVSFILCIFLKRYVLILSIIFCLFGSMLSFLALRNYPFPNLNISVDQVISWCKQINIHREVQNKKNNKCVINNPFKSKTVYALNAFCDCFTITTDIEKGYVTVDKTLFSKSVELNQFVNTSKDPTDEIKRYLNEYNFDELYIVGRNINDLDPKFEKDRLAKDSSIYVITK